MGTVCSTAAGKQANTNPIPVPWIVNIDNNIEMLVNLPVATLKNIRKWPVARINIPTIVKSMRIFLLIDGDIIDAKKNAPAMTVK